MFWSLVVACWIIAIAGVTILAGFLLYGGHPSGVTSVVSHADPTAVVLSHLGQPDERDANGQAWASMAGPGEKCPTSDVGEAWLYRHWFAKDALIVFDHSGRVACVREGTFFMYRSH